MIIHVDMDAFFASVEQRDDPALRGKPVIVGGDRNSKRGVVSTASYEARRFGVHSAMPITEAIRRCPEGIFLRGNGKSYREAHEQIKAIWATYTPDIQVVSIDEAFLDVTGCDRLFGTPREIAVQIQTRIDQEVQLSCSIGVATNKLVAKVASEHRKPHGLTVIPAGKEAIFFDPKPIRALWGVGPVLERKLQMLGLETIGDVAAADPLSLQRVLGPWAGQLQAMARGEGKAHLSAPEPRKQVGQEETFPEDIGDRERLEAHLLGQAREVAATLRKREQLARKVTIKLRDGHFRTQSRAMTLSEPTDDDQLLYRAAVKLLHRHWQGEALRLIGLTAGDLQGERSQLLLFDQPQTERSKGIGDCLDRMSEKFGTKSITWAKTLLADE
jgi:DNA polymerase-4